MVEQKTCGICGNKIVLINCHYSCDHCGISENCHDLPHIIQENKSSDL